MSAKIIHLRQIDESDAWFRVCLAACDGNRKAARYCYGFFTEATEEERLALAGYSLGAEAFRNGNRIEGVDQKAVWQVNKRAEKRFRPYVAKIQLLLDVIQFGEQSTEDWLRTMRQNPNLAAAMKTILYEDSARSVLGNARCDFADML